MENGNIKECKKTIRLFALASFLNDFGSDIIAPVWPLFLTEVLKTNMAMLGFIDGLGDAIVSISQAVSGYISDRIRKRKVFVWLGYLCGGLSRLGYAVSTSWQQIIPFRILDRAGKIRGAPRDAIIADISMRENRGGNFGLLRMMDNLGAVFGIVTSILLLGFLGYRNLFLLAAIPSVIGVILIIFFIKENKPVDSRIYKGLTFRDLTGNFRLFVLLSAVFALGSFSYSFLLIFAKQNGFQPTTVPVLYLVFAAAASIASIPFGKLSDKIGRKNVLMMSFVFWALVCANAILFRTDWSIVLIFILFGLHKGALEPVQKTFAAELTPAAFRASGLGGLQMVIGLCALPSSVIAGLLWDKISIETPFYLSLGLTVLATVLLMFVKESKPEQPL
ncbi:MAG: MFS transporter [Planctomycetota bacterium]